MSLKNITKEDYIRGKILSWYKYNSRELPWRTSKGKKLINPYNIFVSEFMLQQTTVRAVIPKFNEFIKLWPTIKDFSRVRESTILRFWAGLGYYVRAKHLLKSVKLIAKKHNNIIPDEYIDLIELPGVGEYTAKAILGIAYNKPVMPIDANIERIIKRIYGISQYITQEKPQIKELADGLISKKNSSNFIQALMDYGSIVCIFKSPKCKECVVQDHCIAFKKKLTSKIPLKKINHNIRRKKYTRAYLIINEFNEILVRRRPSQGMLQSMLELPNDIWVKYRQKLVRDNIFHSPLVKLYKLKAKKIYSFSHFDLHIETYFSKVKKTKMKNYSWIPLKNINKSGLPTVMKQIVELYFTSI